MDQGKDFALIGVNFSIENSGITARGDNIELSLLSSAATEDNSDNYTYDIDEEWFTQSLVEDNLSHWLSAASTDNGFFRTALNRQWQPVEEQIATLVSQCRLLYVMAEGYQITQERKYLEAVQKGANFLLENFRAKDHEWYWSVSPEGKVIDNKKSSYGYAFAIFGFSHAYRVTSYEPYLDAALSTVHRLDVWDQIKTFPNKRQEGSWTQNHMMHTFEALLALHDATGDRRTLEDVRLLADFIFDKLYQKKGGYLPETFDSNWKSLSPEKGGYVDIGHQVEWAFFLSRAVEKGIPERYLNIGQRLLNFSLKNGYDHERGGIFSRSSYSGNVSNAHKSWWGQSEFLRAVMQYASIHNRRELWPKYQQTLEFVQKYFLDSEYGGWFSEPVDPTRPINDANVKGTIWKAGYHVTGMYVQALQLHAQGLVD